MLALTVVPNHSENHRFLPPQHLRINQPLEQTLAKQNHLPFYVVRQPRKIFLFKLIFITTIGVHNVLLPSKRHCLEVLMIIGERPKNNKNIFVLSSMLKPVVLFNTFVDTVIHFLGFL